MRRREYTVRLRSLRFPPLRAPMLISLFVMPFTAYSFLDPALHHGLVAAYVFGIAAGEGIIFVVVRYAIVFRERCAIRSGRVTSTSVTPAGAASEALGVHNRGNSTTILSMTQRTRSLDTGADTAARGSTGKGVDVQEDWDEVHVTEAKLSLQSTRSMVAPDENHAPATEGPNAA